MKRFAILSVLLLALCACESGDDHGHEHGEETHDDHGSGHGSGHESGHESGEHSGPHDEHEHDDHDHGDETVGWTSFTDTTQMFTEYQPLHAGELSAFRIHLTQLESWRPVDETKVEVTLDMGGKKTGTFAKVVAPGIYEAEIAPQRSGAGSLIVQVGESDKHSREIAVSKEGDHDDLHEGHDEEGHDHGTLQQISFSLEQQWSIDFGLAQVAPGEVRPTFDAFGTLQPRVGGEGVVHANSRGRISGDSIPRLGDSVERGQTLAWLTPSVAEQGDFASLDLAVRQARTRLKAAKVERDRLARLVADGVVPQRRLTEASFDVDEAEANLSAAKTRIGQARGVSGTGQRPRGSVALKAPIDGVVVGVDVPPGLIVESGRPLFRIVDPDPLWLRVDVPEIHVSSLDTVTGVWFTVQGFDAPFELYDTPVFVGGTVSPESRTLPVIAEVPNPSGRLRPGMFADVHVVRGQAADALIVPRRAIVFEEGVPVAYAMVDGESFERRPLRLGPRTSGGFVVERGLEDGEWVVTDGAFAVRLAALGDQSGGNHGHAH